MEAIYRAVLQMYNQPHRTPGPFKTYAEAQACVEDWSNNPFYGKTRTGHVEVAVPVWGKTA